MPPSPKIGPYLIRRPFSRYLMKLTDTFLSLFFSHQPSDTPFPIKRILISNLGHLGDVVISTCILPILKSFFPKIQIGFLLPSSTKCVLENHPLVDFIHTYDYRCFKGSSFRELKKLQYSTAIDLSFSFPNAIPLLARAKIPHRIGYESGGFSPLLTSSFPWNHENHYVGYSHLHLLKALKQLPENLIDQTSPLPHYPLEMGTEPSGLPPHYIVFHPGSSSPLKEWPLKSWIQLAEKMKSLNLPIFITGKGEKETRQAESICKGFTHVHNLSDRCTWAEFVYTIQHTQLLISSDSVAVHLAASQNIPTTILFAGINSPLMWAPPHPHCKTLQAFVPCSPCFNKKGCKSMSCIQTIHPAGILQTFRI